MNRRALLAVLGLWLVGPRRIAMAAGPAGEALIGAAKRGDLAAVEALLERFRFNLFHIHQL